MAANVLGLLLGGPTLMVWGTDEQKERWLGAMKAGDGLERHRFPGAVGAEQHEDLARREMKIDIAERERAEPQAQILDGDFRAAHRPSPAGKRLP